MISATQLAIWHLGQGVTPSNHKLQNKNVIAIYDFFRLSAINYSTESVNVFVPTNIPSLPDKPSQPLVSLRTGSVVINHISTTGETLLPSATINGPVGMPYTSSPANINNYVFQSVNGSPNGLIIDGLQTVTFIYAPVITPPVEEETEPPVVGPLGTVTVNYIDTTGQALSPSFSFTGEINTNYGTSARNIDGYQLISIPNNASGTFIDGTISVDYVYDLIGNIETVDIIDEEIPLDDGSFEGEQPIEDQSSTDTNTTIEIETDTSETNDSIVIELDDDKIPTSDGQLPKTGEFPFTHHLILGSLLIFLGIFIRKI